MKWTLIAALLMAGAAGAAEEDWRATMRKLSTALSETVPYLYPDPTLNEKALTEKAKNLADITKSLDMRKHGLKSPDNDPVVPYIATMFRSELDRAVESLQDGHAEYGKSVLRSSVAFCVACHTRRESGPQFPLLAAFEKSLQKASWIERMEFTAGSRQYDTLLSEVMGKLSGTGTPKISALDLERASRMALSVLVRVKKDPDRAALLAQAMGKSTDATLSMKEASKVWMKDIRDWQDARGKTFAEPLKEAERLAGGRLTDHGEVRLLRATAILHELLQKSPEGEDAARALYIAGRAYDQLGEIGLWNLHEFYYLACIDKAPHTTTAEKCYRAYDETMTLGYSGSSGVHLPKSVKEDLARLKEKAAPAKKP